MNQRTKRFFTSDLHFFHKNIIEYCNRPYKDVPQMQEAMVKIWNSVVPPDGVVYVLGDFGFIGVEEGHKMLSRLNGIKYLIHGNHDYSVGKMEHMGFSFVAEKAIVELEGRKYLLSHFPYRHKKVRYYDLHPKKGEEDWLLHGHVHNNWPKVNLKKKMINVCWDVWKRPVSISEITSIIAKEERCITTNLLQKLLSGWVFKRRVAITKAMKLRCFKSMLMVKHKVKAGVFVLCNTVWDRLKRTKKLEQDSSKLNT